MADDNIFDNSSTESILNPTESESPPSEGTGSAEGAPPTENPATPAALTAEDIGRLIDEKTSDLRMQNTYLRGRLIERDEQQKGQQPPPTEGPKEFTYDFDQMGKDLESNAPKAVTDYIRAYSDYNQEKLLGEVRKIVNGAIGQNEQQRSSVEAHRGEVQALVNKYGQDMLNDKDFAKDADAALWDIIKARGGTKGSDYQPGDLLSAASRVYGEWAVAGKIKSKGNNGNGISLREIRQRPSFENGFGDRNGNGGQATGPPTSIDTLFNDPRDRAIAKRMLKESQVGEPRLTEANWVKSYLRAKEDHGDDFSG